MKKDIHPTNNLVCFSDVSTGKNFYRSTMKSSKTENHDGVDHLCLLGCNYGFASHTLVRNDLILQVGSKNSKPIFLEKVVLNRQFHVVPCHYRLKAKN